MAVNVLGTWHVLLAAEAADIGRVVRLSSVQALGTGEGERLPDYLPIDDAHPRRAMRAYGLSKRLAEDLCAGASPVVALIILSMVPVLMPVRETGRKRVPRRRAARWVGSTGSALACLSPARPA